MPNDYANQYFDIDFWSVNWLSAVIYVTCCNDISNQSQQMLHKYFVAKDFLHMEYGTSVLKYLKEFISKQVNSVWCYQKQNVLLMNRHIPF